jgi:hypothetical protein
VLESQSNIVNCKFDNQEGNGNDLENYKAQEKNSTRNNFSLTSKTKLSETGLVLVIPDMTVAILYIT